MGVERRQNCWDIMQCDEETQCAVRQNKHQHCWEWMKKNNEFQCEFGLCSECIVYLSQNDNTILSQGEIERIMVDRGLYRKDILQGPEAF